MKTLNGIKLTESEYRAVMRIKYEQMKQREQDYYSKKLAIKK